MLAPYADDVALIAITLHRQRAAAIELTEALIPWLTELGHTCALPRLDAEAAGLGQLGVDEASLGVGADLALSLGGDGNVLRTVRAVADDGVPVLGINFGHLGYLTEVEPADAFSAIRRFFAGEHQVEERMRLKVAVDGAKASPWNALNEVVIEKADSGRTVRLQVDLNQGFFTTYSADGLIVATPTGSTAYSLSARGPILDPMHRALLLTPVAPHSLFDRSIVLSPQDTVGVAVLENRETVIAVDGRAVCQLEVGQLVTCSEAIVPARIVSFGGNNFRQVLKAKFGLND